MNLILLLLAVGAVFQAEELALRPKITGTLALTGIAVVHLWMTDRSGYLPGRATNPRLEDSRNVAGIVTLGLVAFDALAVIGVLLS